MLALVVDDNELNLVIASKMLENYGFEVTKAQSGIQALQSFNSKKPCLILLDCKMPDMDGFEVARKIRQIEEINDLKRTLIIAVSGDTQPESIARCKESGMDNFVSKPVSVETLYKIIDDYRNLMQKDDSPVDKKALMASADDDAEWAEELLKLFLSDTLERIKEVEESIKSNMDNEMITRNFHTIKSSAASIGAVKLSQISKELEELSRTVKVSDISDKIKQFKEEMKTVENFIKSGCRDLGR